MSEYAHLSTVDPELAVILAKWPAAPPPKDAFEAKVGFVAYTPLIHAAQEKDLPKESEYKVTDHEIPVGGGAKVNARVIVPTPKEGESGSFPLLFWMHGGGWTVGDLHMDDYKLRRVAVDARISIVNCEYRMATDHPFPTPHEDCFAALKFVASNPTLFSADLSKGFLTGGGSAGGNLSAVLSHLARDDPFFKDTPLTGQLLVYPCVVFPAAYPEKYKDRLLSLEQNKDAPFLGKADVDRFIGWYGAPPKDPRASPLLLDSHVGLAPAYIQICGMDPLRDEAFLYEQVLKEAGVKTKVDIYPGVIHGFELLAPEIKQAKKFNADFIEGVKWALGLGH